MDLQRNSPSSSSTSSTPSNSSHHHPPNGIPPPTTPTPTTPPNPMHSWWESISKARSRIHLLSTLLPPTPPLSTLADSDQPARSLLNSQISYDAVSLSLNSPSSGSGNDPLCHWLYDTYLSSDPDLRLVVLSYIPLLSSLYLSRIIHNNNNNNNNVSLSGFEAVLLALYSSETKARNGKPVLVSIPDLSQPSLYHIPPKTKQQQQQPVISQKKSSPSLSNSLKKDVAPSVAVLSPPLEPFVAVKSTKRACIVGVALDCYYKCVSQMPSWSKLDFCKAVVDWAGDHCPCVDELDELTDLQSENSNGVCDRSSSEIEDVSKGFESFEIDEVRSKGRIPLPWELMQPSLRILGHCLLGPLNAEDVKEAASVAVRRLYARASHDLDPQAILASRSLVQLDKRARDAAAKLAVVSNAGSNANTPSKAKKPEILLVSK